MNDHDQQKFKDKYRIPSARLKNYDYSSAGAYFITICTKDRHNFFGTIIGDQMQLSPIGQIVHDEWIKTEKIRSKVIVDKFVIMPNHVHGILVLTEDQRRRDVLAKRLYNNQREKNYTGTNKTMSKISPHKDSVSNMIKFFKRQVTKYARENTNIYTVWQTRFHDRIIRDEQELNRIRQYVMDNPKNWADDENNIQ
jgi:putative transposase